MKFLKTLVKIAVAMAILYYGFWAAIIIWMLCS